MLTKGLDGCSICFERIKNLSKGYKPTFSLGFVCENCSNNFTPKEKETIIHAFNVARGIFNVDEKDKMIVKDVLYDVYSELKLQNKRSFTTESIFQKILIRSQLYGLSLNSFFCSKYFYSKNISKNSNCTICDKPVDAELKSNVLTFKNESTTASAVIPLMFSVVPFITIPLAVAALALQGSKFLLKWRKEENVNALSFFFDLKKI